MTKRDWTDAKFEIVKPPPVSRRHEKWNGVGLPPEWEEATWYGQLLYLACFGGVMSLIIWGLHAFVKAYVNL